MHGRGEGVTFGHVSKANRSSCFAAGVSKDASHLRRTQAHKHALGGIGGFIVISDGAWQVPNVCLRGHHRGHGCSSEHGHGTSSTHGTHGAGSASRRDMQRTALVLKPLHRSEKGVALRRVTEANRCSCFAAGISQDASHLDSTKAHEHALGGIGGVIVIRNGAWEVPHVRLRSLGAARPLRGRSNGG
jgi:hypothetical protein